MLYLLNTKLLGGALLLTGTAIGGGLLALPIVTAEAGFINASFLMIFCWLLMTLSAFLTLEISLKFPYNANIISMTQKSLGRPYTIVAWVSYLLLFYFVLAAYIAAGSDFLHHVIQPYSNMYIPKPLLGMLFILSLGSIVYQGLAWVDYCNRFLMLAKLGLYSALVITIFPHIELNTLLLRTEHPYLIRGLGVLVTSFSFTNIIPSLRSYFKEDISSLRKSIVIGSTIPLICYIFWNASVTGLIPRHGPQGLLKLKYASQLIQQINILLNTRIVLLLSHSFTYVCILTTFLTCSLGLSDFLADGFSLAKQTSKKSDSVIYSATFLPPFLIAAFIPGIFITALDYAGIFCLILFIILPVLMAWKQKNINSNSSNFKYSSFLYRKELLAGLMIIAIAGIFLQLYQSV